MTTNYVKGNYYGLTNLILVQICQTCQNGIIDWSDIRLEIEGTSLHHKETHLQNCTRTDTKLKLDKYL